MDGELVLSEMLRKSWEWREKFGSGEKVRVGSSLVWEKYEVRGWAIVDTHLDVMKKILWVEYEREL